MKSKFLNLLKKYKSQLYFHLLINLLIGVFITLPFYVHIPLKGFQDYSIYFVHFLLIQFSLFGFTYFLCLNKYVFYLLFPLVFTVFSGISFWVLTQDISVSPALIEAIFETSLLVTLDLITLPFILAFILVSLLIYFIIKRYNKIENNNVFSPLTIIAICGICLFFVIEQKRFNTFRSRSAYVTVFSFIDFVRTKGVNLLAVKGEVTAAIDDINVVFVLGEAVRADHFSLNGYHRKTNKLIAQLPNVVSYPNVYTPLTHTVASLQQMLTDRDLEHLKKNDLHSIYSVLNKANYKTKWVANSTVVKSYESIIFSNDEVELIDKFRSIMSFNKALDERMLKPFDSIFIKDGKGQFITLHMTGSHWYYENRYSDDFRKYMPVIDSKYVPSLTKEQMVNSYDNTLLYLDYFLNEVITIIKKAPSKTLLIYLADHGELLGENGKWLHAQGEEASMNPAMLIWYTDDFERAYPTYVKNLKLNSSKKITTDFFFNSMLDLVAIKNFDYKKSQSIFRDTLNFD